MNKGLKALKAPQVKAETARKLKVATGIILGVFAIIYTSFLLVLPNVLDLNKFTPTISTEVEKMTGLKFEAQNLNLKTTWRFGVKVGADKIGLNYKDGKPLITLEAPEIEVNLPTILIGHINLDTIKAKNADAYLVFTKENKYTIFEYVDKIMQSSTPEEPAQTEEQGFNFPIKIQNIDVKTDKIALHLLDENVNKTYLAQLNNTNLHLNSLNGPLKLSTTGFIGIEDSSVKFLNADVNFKTKFPKPAEKTTSGHAATQEEIIFDDFNINPFRTLEDFNLRSKITANLDIKDIDDFKAKGSVDIDKFSLKLSDYQLPDSKVQLAFKDKNIDINSKAYVSKEEFLTVNGSVKTGKKSNLNLDVKTEKITLNSLKNIVGAVLRICLIENDIDNIAANGYITSDFNLNTDFKTVKSKGHLKLIDGNLSYPKANLFVTNLRSYLDFSDNALRIKDTGASLNGAGFDVKGEIASNATINLSVKSDPLKIKDIVNLAVQFKAVNAKDIADFEFNDGLLTVLVDVLGDFNNIQPKADIKLDQFKMLVKSAKMPVNIENISIVARPKGKDDIDASVNVKNVTASMPDPALHFSAPNAKLALDMKDITLQPLSASLENTKINLSGKILNYMQTPELDIKVSGNVHPNTVFAFIPKEFRSGISYRGAMPYTGTVTGALNNIKIAGDVTSNPENYIGIVDIPSIKGLTNILSLDIALKNDSLDLLEINEASIKSSGTKIASAKGVVKSLYAPEPVLSGLNISLPNKTKIIVPMLGNASFNASGNLSLSGKAFSPEMTGTIDVDNVNYPDYDFKLENLALNFNKNILNAKAKNATVAKSDFSGDASISTNFANGVVINNLNYSSNYIDSDALIALADKVMKDMPQPTPSASSGGSAPADLGVIIKSGAAKIGKLKSGTLYVTDIAYDHTLLNNIYSLNNLGAIFAGGKAQGKVTYNVMNGKIGIDMGAEGISMKDAAKAFIGKEIIRAGTLGGKAKLTLSGATYEQQIKSLNGSVSFEVKDGEYGDSISFTRFINAINVSSLAAFKSALATATSKVGSVDTQEFKDMTGILTFNNGVANVASFKSRGPNMSLYANGTFNLLTNYANLKVTGCVSSKVAGLLGTLGTDKIQTQVEKVATVAGNAVNKVAENLANSSNKGVQAGLAILGAIKTQATGGTTTAATSSTTEETSQKTAGQIVSTVVKQSTNPLFGAIPAADIANVPALSTSETANIKNFQVTLNGVITSPKAVKGFKFQSVPQAAQATAN